MGTFLGLAADGNLLAVFTLEDRLKENARYVLDNLHRLNLDVYMVSGDQPAVAQRIGKALGLQEDHIFAGVRPEGKVDVVKSLQSQGKQVAFVGDGINDAPALTQADLGIAVSLASDIAKESADIILLKADLEAVPEALHLSRRTLLTIRQNLFWAFFYNIAAVPIGGLGIRVAHSVRRRDGAVGFVPSGKFRPFIVLAATANQTSLEAVWQDL